jgi:Holliday junction DNA helicase RuvA
LDVRGVGYEVLTPVGSTARADSGGSGDIVLHIHTHVREDSFELFGFSSELERRVFRLLINVPNVGPKTALVLLSALPPSELSRAVHASDVARLTKVPGIGRKTAERLVLELKEKLPREPRAPEAITGAGAPSAATGDVERKLVDALTKLGYRAAEAERAVKALGERLATQPLELLLRQALSSLTPGRHT